MYRKIDALGTIAAAAAIVLSSCSSIDDNLDDCFIELQADYELHLLTNEQQELARTLGDRPGIAYALQSHLSTVFTDQGRDLDLAFYTTADQQRQRRQTETMGNAPTKRVDISLNIHDYHHLAVANAQGNGAITYDNNGAYRQARLALTPQSPNASEAIASQKTGIFTGRRSFIDMQYGTYPYRMPLYIANSVAALVLDPRTADFTDVKVYTTGFATSFSIADSTYHYDNSPLVRAESVAMPDTTRWIAYCGVSLPSREAAANSHTTDTRLVNLTDAPFSYDDSGEDLWQYECYVTRTDGTTTRTVLTIRHPLRAGQLKVIIGWIDAEGRVQTEEMEVGVSVDLNWNSGIEWEY